MIRDIKFTRTSKPLETFGCHPVSPFVLASPWNSFLSRCRCRGRGLGVALRFPSGSGLLLRSRAGRPEFDGPALLPPTPTQEFYPSQKECTQQKWSILVHTINQNLQVGFNYGSVEPIVHRHPTSYYQSPRLRQDSRRGF